VATITRTITNLNDAFEVIVAETSDHFYGMQLSHLSKNDKKRAVIYMTRLGVLKLREAVQLISGEIKMSRVWVYAVLNENSMLDLSKGDRKDKTK